MNVIVEALAGALDNNIAYAVLMDIVLFFLYFANTLLGALLGSANEGFNAKKLGFGILKAFCVLFIVLGICYIVNVFVLTLNLINGLELDRSIINVLQVLAIIVTTARELLAEIYDKLKSFKQLKYTEDDVVIINDNDVVEPYEFRG